MLQAKEICVLIVARSAKLVASATIAIIKHRSGASLPPARVAIDGRLFNQYRIYRGLLRTALKRASSVQGSRKVHLINIEDGAAFGAAVLGCAAHVQKEQAQTSMIGSDT